MSQPNTELTANQSQSEHFDDGGYLRELYEITSTPDGEFEGKLDDLFVLGCAYFEMDLGAIARIDPETDYFEIEKVSHDHDYFKPGLQLDLSDTYCRAVTDCEGPATVAATDSAYNEITVRDEFGLETYVGTRLELDNQRDRTFFFLSSEPRDRPFTESERTFHHLMGEWLRKELQRKHREEQLRRQNERLESFASMLAHELRNPLNIAQVYMQMAVDGDEGAAEEVMRAHDRLEEMIDILLVIARGANAQIDWEAVNLPEVITDAWEDEATAAATLKVETDDTVPADPTHIRHLFQNLFRNAVEHGRQNATVRVGDLPEGNGFYVEDDGPGIPESDHEAVFAAGYTTDADGIGLGLTFVGQLADTYDWDVSITESPMGGARFEFRDVKCVPQY